MRQPERVQAALVVVRRTPTLFAEVEHRGFVLEEEGAGYLRLEGPRVDAKVIVLDEVAEAEREPLLGLFSGATLSHPRVQRWIAQHTGKVIEVMGAKVAQAHPDFVKAFLASLPAKQRLAGLAPEQRLAGLAPKQRLAGLAPDKVLRALGPERIASAVSALPAADRQKIAAHLAPSARTRARKSKRPRSTRRRRAR